MKPLNNLYDMRRGYFQIILLCGFLGLFETAVYCEVIHVPGDQPTIQEGIDAAQPGDTVLVAEGTYYEEIQMKSGFLRDRRRTSLTRETGFICTHSVPTHSAQGVALQNDSMPLIIST